MATYLITWNPKRWYWEDLQECIEEINEHGYHLITWSCGRNKKILEKDRIFMIRLGSEPRGIFASGWATSNVYENQHWDTKADKTALYVDICLDVLINPERELIFPSTKLKAGILADMHWYSQSSGITIPDEIATRLETDWESFLAMKGIVQQTVFNTGTSLEGVVDTQTYYEGATKQIKLNVYERNANARKQCIRHYGLNCYICGFNFQKFYGDVGVGFIHVHHLKPLSEIASEYELHPLEDLRPVCPNCHAIIHRKKPAYTVEEMQKLLKRE